MATQYLPIPTLAWKPDIDSPPQLTTFESTAGEPNPEWLGWAFDGTTAEYLHAQFQMPGDYVGSLVIRGKCQTNSTAANTFIFTGRIAAITAADAETPQEKAAAAVNNSSAISVNTTEANRVIEFTITLSNADSLAAGDLVDLILGRDPAHTSDTHNAVDVTFLGGGLEYANA